MSRKGKRVQSRSKYVGKRVSPGPGWPCRVLLVLFALLLGLSVWQLAAYLLENRQEKRFMEELRSRAVTVRDLSAEPARELPPITVDFAVLQEENPDVIAWVYCPDTEVNYPVLQSGDNDYYLRRRSDGSHHIAGSIFADCRNAADLSDENLILYGHNMKNGTMFGILPHYAQQEFYEAHPVWYLLTPTANYRAELFAGFVTSTDSLLYSTAWETAEDGGPIMDKAWADSDFRGGPPPVEGERTITLSTCSYEFSNARYVLLGVLRELGGA